MSEVMRIPVSSTAGFPGGGEKVLFRSRSRWRRRREGTVICTDGLNLYVNDVHRESWWRLARRLRYELAYNARRWLADRIAP
jgi:hypothetical protein